MKKIFLIILSGLFLAGLCSVEAKTSKKSSSSATLSPSLIIHPGEGSPYIREDVLTKLKADGFKCIDKKYVYWEDLTTDGDDKIRSEKLTYKKGNIKILVLHAIESGFEGNFEIDIVFPSSSAAKQFVDNAKKKFGYKYYNELGFYMPNDGLWGLAMGVYKNTVSLFGMV